MQEALKEKFKNIPHLPGVYLLKGKKGEVLYVGKANDLRTRIQFHLRGEIKENPRFSSLSKKIYNFDYIVTDNPASALLLEANFIKKYLPKYNIRLKDDKKYPYLKITVNEPFPRIFKTRDLTDDGSILFGPFHSVKAVRKTIKGILKIFPLRTCKYKIPSKRKINPCLEYYLKRCPAPCVPEWQNPEEYKKNVFRLIKFFSGETAFVEKVLEREINRAKEKLLFEKAIQFRDQLYALRDIHKPRVGVISQVEKKESLFLDVIGISQEGKYAAVLIFPVKFGKVQEKETYFLVVPENITEPEIIEEFLIQYYSRGIIRGKRILIPFQIKEKNSIELMIREKRGVKIKIVFSPKRPEEKKLLEFAKDNAKFALEQELINRGIYREKYPSVLREIQEIFSLEKVPLRIEALDASQTFGDERVGAIVVFENGKPKKSEYRKYKIKDTKKTADPYLVYEIAKRRIRRIIEEKKDFPEIFIVDGGKPQLNFVKKAFEEENVKETLVLAFAKTFDQIYVSGSEKEQMIFIPRNKPLVLKFFKHIRKEAHRFSLTFHRARRGKKIQKSILNGIYGIGEKKKKELIRYFGSVERILSASIDEIKKIPGFGEIQAKKIYKKIHKIETLDI